METTSTTTLVSYDGTVKQQSYPIQDEPEGEVGFQYKMSLKGMAC